MTMTLTDVASESDRLQHLLNDRDSFNVKRFPTFNGYAPDYDDDALRDIAETTVAFLNGHGGVIFIQDWNYQHEKRLRSHLWSRISPSPLLSVREERLDGAKYVVVEVPEGEERPYVYAGGVFVREGAVTRPARVAEISRLIKRRYSEPTRWEQTPLPDLEERDLNEAEIKAMIAEARRIGRLSTSDKSTFDVLDDLRLRENGMLTNAALALFGLPGAVRRLPQMTVRAARFADDSENVLTDNQTYFGNLFTLRDRADAFLRSALPICADLRVNAGMARRDTPALPWPAVREGLINAFVHRDYAATDGSVILRVYPDRLEIWNPGRLPEGLTVQDLQTGNVSSRPHNPTIAEVFLLFGLMERLGSGARRILYHMKQENLPPPQWQVSSGGILLTLRWKAPNSPTTSQGVLNDMQREFLRGLKSGDAFKSADYQAVVPQLTDRSVRNHLRQMTEAGYVAVSGGGSRTLYRRTEKPLPDSSELKRID